MSEKLLLVDKNDNLIGRLDNNLCHLGAGKLHRAFSVFIFNSQGELLLQQRSKDEKLWPLCWTNSCTNHPKVDESYIQAGKRKVLEELGLQCKLEFIYKFNYQAKYFNLGTEREVCGVLAGKTDEKPEINQEMVFNYKFVNIHALLDDIKINKEQYTPWLVKELKDLTTKHYSSIKHYYKK